MAFEDSINYKKELFHFLKGIFPDARALPKIYNKSNPSRYPRVKASIIICPNPDCNYYCIEDRDPLIDHFLRHIKKVHHVNPSNQFIENLKGKISYLRNNNHIPYTNPFIHVQWEGLF